MLWLNIVLLIISIALIASILLQNRSAGIGGAFGGGAEGFHVRRGSEKRLFQVTVVLGALFLITAAAHLFVN
ncbi:MAG: preprotein translocase subunit SecG [Candidatus Andersenbacteria bacterium]